MQGGHKQWQMQCSRGKTGVQSWHHELFEIKKSNTQVLYAQAIFCHQDITVSNVEFIFDRRTLKISQWSTDQYAVNALPDWWQILLHCLRVRSSWTQACCCDREIQQLHASLVLPTRPLSWAEHLPLSSSLMPRTAHLHNPISITWSLLFSFYLTVYNQDNTGYVPELVSWSLTSFFSTNMAISERKGQGWKVIRTQWRKASDMLTSTLAAFLFSSHPKKGKGSRGSFKLLC